MKCQKTIAAANEIFLKRRNYFHLPILLVFLTFTGNLLFAQNKVSGKVTAGGTPLTGVTVKEKSRANPKRTTMDLIASQLLQTPNWYLAILGLQTQ
ncbi:hypothetical protein [Ferruginibacter sp.]|uniref:hypothetical protein n=1 Tax=Ferruginibacter sp. TaxID=1940288 RepID=UPI00265B0B25|nr:hypothetical protein [Ferruginibacter sp.]